MHDLLIGGLIGLLVGIVIGVYSSYPMLCRIERDMEEHHGDQYHP